MYSKYATIDSFTKFSLTTNLNREASLKLFHREIDIQQDVKSRT